MFVFSYTVGIQYYEKHEKKTKTNGQHPFSTNDKLVGGFEFPF